MLSQLLRTLLGSEPCVRLVIEPQHSGKDDKGYQKDHEELALACRKGLAYDQFLYHYGGGVFYIAQYDKETLKKLHAGLVRFPVPTVSYDLYRFTKKLL